MTLRRTAFSVGSSPGRTSSARALRWTKGEGIRAAPLRSPPHTSRAHPFARDRQAPPAKRRRKRELLYNRASPVRGQRQPKGRERLLQDRRQRRKPPPERTSPTQENVSSLGRRCPTRIATPLLVHDGAVPGHGKGPASPRR